MIENTIFARNRQGKKALAMSFNFPQPELIEWIGNTQAGEVDRRVAVTQTGVAVEEVLHILYGIDGRRNVYNQKSAALEAVGFRRAVNAEGFLRQKLRCPWDTEDVE